MRHYQPTVLLLLGLLSFIFACKGGLNGMFTADYNGEPFSGDGRIKNSRPTNNADLQTFTFYSEVRRGNVIAEGLRFKFITAEEGTYSLRRVPVPVTPDSEFPTATMTTLLSGGDIAGPIYHLLESDSLTNTFTIDQAKSNWVSGTFNVTLVTTGSQFVEADTVRLTNGSFTARYD